MELAIVLIVALVIFGPKRLPELGNSLGRGIKEFKGSIGGDGDKEAALSPGRPTGELTGTEEIDQV